ncbi:small GTP-binding protein, putative [Trichomonas vaginalis G3]|uniref:Small GTP-binding protein, putative n=1 Tax=Trichomonas vaginalis (strain ATCC PRA-98 / G3) TaxID=412133 RepID=A2FQ27_TRIV3|nr:GTPase protein [Trichomonas vaginalis G3]EAX92991.1 small GTP-binding protein, putative [Trichomonas vaginalis G3]KAI5508105.1 GTPase protein [Trichomonas vaginalis G3]|eukprot:XP_001305921.1 small GTP-binding protein [Trichomonas vaginalis G3]
MIGNSRTQPEPKVVLVGDSGVGKTAIIQNFITGILGEQTEPTVIATSFKTEIELEDGVKEEISIWDTAGQERFQSLIPLYLRNARGLILVADITAKNNIQTLDTIYMSLNDLDPTCICILAANKIDLDLKKDISDLEKWATDHHFSFTTVSAKTGSGIRELFIKITKLMREATPEQHYFNSKTTLREDPNKKNIPCC